MKEYNLVSIKGVPKGKQIRNGGRSFYAKVEHTENWRKWPNNIILHCVENKENK